MEIYKRREIQQSGETEEAFELRKAKEVAGAEEALFVITRKRRLVVLAPAIVLVVVTAIISFGVLSFLQKRRDHLPPLTKDALSRLVRIVGSMT